MTNVTQVTLTCDVCGNVKDVETRTFELDGKAYEIDLCRKDGNALGRVAARYITKARKVTARPGRRQRGGKPRSRAANAARGDGAKAKAASSKKAARASHGQPRNAKGASTPAASSRQRKSGKGASTPAASPRQRKTTPAASSRQRKKGIYVYGILPADIEVAADITGVGEHAGPLHDVSLDGLAALVSEVDLSGTLGSPDDLRIYREILDDTAAEVPILPLRFGTVLTSEDAVAEELLAANHDEFTAALERLEGRAEFQVKGRYIEDAVPDEAVAARRDEDTRALKQAMESVAVASVEREPAHELDSVHVAFLVAVDQEHEVERVVEGLSRDWEGRVDVQLLGPMAAYDFTGTAQPES